VAIARFAVHDWEMAAGGNAPLWMNNNSPGLTIGSCYFARLCAGTPRRYSVHGRFLRLQ
jgi:hypothetical protein